MAMQFEELDAETRRFMLKEFDAEEAGPAPYRGRGLTPAGRAAFAVHMRAAIEGGTELSLCQSLLINEYWEPEERYVRAGVERIRQVNVPQATERLALTEFNTWYVRGLSARLIKEGVARCQAYRAEMPRWDPSDCPAHEGTVYSVATIYAGHRLKYWPEPGQEAAVSIPFGPGCHHTIRRFV